MPFTDILDANAEYNPTHKDLGSGRARRGLAIVTCIDSRIDPLAMFGLVPGDAKMIRNAGARVTDDVLRTLILATHVLGVERVALVAHTDCGATSADQSKMESIVKEATGEDATDVDFLMVEDQAATLRADAELIRNSPLIAPGVEVGTFIFDVRSGRLDPVD
jgi:carbonic anhydrase